MNIGKHNSDTINANIIGVTYDITASSEEKLLPIISNNIGINPE